MNSLLKSDNKKNYWWKQDRLYFFTYFETIYEWSNYLIDKPFFEALY